MSKSKRARAQLREFLRTGELPSPPPAAAPLLVEEARRQGLSGLLHLAARSWPRPWPATALDALGRAHRDDLVRGVRQLEMGAQVGALLAGHGLRCLPLKGAAVAEWLYASVADRPMGDVDLLALDDPDAARRLLLTEGFAEVGSADHAVVFRDPVWGGVLELHSSLTSCPGLFPVDAEGLWSRSRPTTGQIARIPAPEDVLLHLSLHASFQHGLVLSLVQWLDFKRLLERSPIDSDRLLDLARRSGAVTALSAAMDAAEAVVGAPVPSALREALPPLRRQAWLGGRLKTPLALLCPAEPELARTRWKLLAGRRLQLVRLTLQGRTSGSSPGSYGWGALRRAGLLFRRWTWPSLRAWRASP